MCNKYGEIYIYIYTHDTNNVSHHTKSAKDVEQLLLILLEQAVELRERFLNESVVCLM